MDAAEGRREATMIAQASTKSIVMVLLTTSPEICSIKIKMALGESQLTMWPSVISNFWVHLT